MKPRLIFITTLLFLSVLRPSALLAQGNRGLVIYSNDFEGMVGSEWSNTKTDRTPSSRNFLGQFSNGTVSLILANLPTHHEVTVSFDLFIIQSWDGNQGGPGPDIWDLSVAGGPTLLHTTFANWPAERCGRSDRFWRADTDHL